MRITVFGAAGNVGGRVVAEALDRGHEVTAVVRDENRFAALATGAAHRVGDAANPADVARLTAGHDVAVAATRPAPGREGDLLTTTRALLAGLRGSAVRLLVVGGAATLTVPGTRRTAIEDPTLVPPAWRAIAQASAEQLALCRSTSTVDWAYLSPPALLAPGKRTGRYRLGVDELLIGADGTSMISTADLAVALLDEAERPRHRHARFTVAY